MTEEAKTKPQIQIDLTKPRSMRPMFGYDIETWRGENNLAKDEAQHALGFRNSNHYNEMCNQALLPVTLELLIRLYEEIPSPRPWERYTLPELFELMYGDALAPFVDTAFERPARVDLSSRFCVMLGRSPERRYQWLDTPTTKNADKLSAYPDVGCVLAKLRQVPDPKKLLERLARKTLSLRGIDLDTEWPVPTPRHPPRREKTGRKARTPEEIERARLQKERERAIKAAKVAKERAKKGAKLKESTKKSAATKAARPAARKKPPAGTKAAAKKNAPTQAGKKTAGRRALAHA
jgi:hypothetical protein